MPALGAGGREFESRYPDIGKPPWYHLGGSFFVYDSRLDYSLRIVHLGDIYQSPKHPQIGQIVNTVAYLQKMLYFCGCEVLGI